ncbi:MAG: 2-succinyl-5-enolpyruvyl-6-hydroxy-3-cyclohexene-1-carboxylic-acid synthase, partial [Acidimicrobiales bacterium]
NNDGGGIFSFLPQAQALPAQVFQDFVATPHGLDLARLVAAYGVEVTTVTQARDLMGAVVGCLGAGGVRMVHVRTDRAANVLLHAELDAEVAAAAAGAG